MLLKERTESDELKTLRSLNTRMDLSDKDKVHYYSLEKGYAGELLFDKHLESLQEDCYIISDLLLELHGSYFQIDSLVISQGILHLFDTKNFQGDFCLDSDKLYSLTTNREYKNPVDQLKRCESLTRQLLQSLKQHYSIQAEIVFVNPEFTLYQAPMNLPIIFPTQINRLINDLNSKPSVLGEKDKKLANQLISLHQTKNPFAKISTYTYDQLQKGVTCGECRSFLVKIKDRKCMCEKCGYEEFVSEAVIRSVNEIKLLFPNKKITNNLVYDWCKIVPHRRVGQILGRHYKVNGVRQWAYYE
ncbi:nuclease-related domain-containing protein [Bacillaceae bacterium S4-13-56]